MPVQQFFFRLFIVFSLCLSGSLHAESTTLLPGMGLNTTTDKESAALPEAAEVADELARLERELAELTPESEAAEELSQQIAFLKRQKNVLAAIAALPAQVLPLPALPADGSAYPITLYDEWLKALSDIESQIPVNAEHLDSQKQVTLAALNQIETLQKQMRKLGEELPTPERDMRLQHLRRAEATAKAWWQLSKLEVRLLSLTDHQLLSVQQKLVTARPEIKKKTVFARSQLEQQIASIEERSNKLRARLASTQSQAEKVRALWIKNQKKAARDAESTLLQEELAASYQNMHALQLQAEWLQFGLERAAIEKFAWQLRHQVWQGAPKESLTENRENLRAKELVLDQQMKVLNQHYETLTRDYGQLTATIEALDARPGKWQVAQRDALTESMNRISAEKNLIGGTMLLIQRVREESDWSLDEVSLAELWQALSTTVAKIWGAEILVFDDQAITLGKLIVGIILLMTGIWIAKLFSKMIGSWMLSRLKLDEGVIAVIQTVVFYVLLISVVLFALKLINIPLTVFTVLGGALAIGIGFGSQNLMSNFISGLILLAERPIRVGDFIQIGDLMGVISHIGARSTKLKTPQNVDIIVPNSNLLEDRVTNWTLSDTKVRTSILVGVAYGSDVERVSELLKKAAEDHKRVLNQPPPVVLFTDFGDNALSFELLIWVNMRRLLERRMVESDLRFRIDQLFREANICIAFPQRDVHLDTLRPLEVKMVSAQERD